MDIHCVTRWSKFDTNGRRLGALSVVLPDQAEAPGALCGAASEYGFTANLPVEVVWRIISPGHHYHGEPITPDHGYPLRVWWRHSG